MGMPPREPKVGDFIRIWGSTHGSSEIVKVLDVSHSRIDTTTQPVPYVSYKDAAYGWEFFGEVETNSSGGSQAKIESAPDLLPPKAILEVSTILKYGEDTYGANNWRKIPQKDHLRHALRHVFMYLAQDKTENHLGNATCRLLFALETE